MQENPVPAYISEYHLLRKMVRIFLGFTVMILFVHLNPNMPDIGLDASWKFGMNQAIAQKMVIGKDIIFPGGPYASVYTHIYYPATDRLMLFGGLILGLSNTLLLLYLCKDKSIIWQILFTCFLAAGIFMDDVLLFFYPLLFTFFIYSKMVNYQKQDVPDFDTQLLIGLSFIPLGLIVLIKGSTITMTFVIVIASAVLFWKKGLKTLSVSALLIPFFSALILLVIAGQPLIGLWYYLKNMVEITSGYSGAMYMNGRKSELICYVFSSALILFFCYTNKLVPKSAKYFLCICLGIYFFTAFKGGFTRHDGHAMMAAGCLLSVPFLLSAILKLKNLYLVFGFSAFSWLYITYQYAGLGVLNVFRPLPAIYVESVDGLMARLSSNPLKNRYKDRLASIKNDHLKIPEMPGTTDIYSYEQSHLLATENKWSPRPVFQSYSAYTEKLAKLNEAHLTSPDAPDNIIFSVQTIDQHIPSLDDGISWPTIINNYLPGKNESGFLYLTKKRPITSSPVMSEVLSKTYSLDEIVKTPDTTQMLFLKVDLQETIAGKLITSLYQPEPVEMFFTFADGNTRKYTMIPQMAKSGFIFSPLVENINEFASLFNQSLPDNLKSKIVTSFRISSEGLGVRKKITSWEKKYKVQFYKIIYN